MSKTPKMTFLMQAHASALLAMAGRSTAQDRLKLARCTLDVQPLPIECGAAVAAFLNGSMVDMQGAGRALRAFVLENMNMPLAAPAPHYAWQDRADLR